jgi:S1-C subfamily serine protease
MRLSRSLFPFTGRSVTLPSVPCRRLSSQVKPVRGKGAAYKWAWAVAGAGVCASIAAAYDSYEGSTTSMLQLLLPVAQAQPKASSSHLLTKNFVADAVAIAAPSVVNIASISGNGFIPMGSAGSGFIISKVGLESN